MNVQPSRLLVLVALAGLWGLGGQAPEACAADQPLRVYTSGAPGAAVYVTPQERMSSGAGSNSDLGFGAFGAGFLRGKTPLQLDLRPGLYLVSVMPQPDYSMRDAMMKAAEFVWDGYDYHAIVAQPNYRWRYTQCYLVDKKKDVAAEVLAVFTDRMPDAEAISYDLGQQATHFTAAREVAEKMLDAAHVNATYYDDILAGVQAGMKVIVRDGSDRWVVCADGPERLKISSARSSGAWAGHRLSVCNGENNIF